MQLIQISQVEILRFQDQEEEAIQVSIYECFIFYF